MFKVLAYVLGEGIFAEVSKAFQEDKVPWPNVIGLSLDNASVNMGRHNGLYRKFEAKCDDIRVSLSHHSQHSKSCIQVIW